MTNLEGLYEFSGAGFTELNLGLVTAGGPLTGALYSPAGGSISLTNGTYDDVSGRVAFTVAWSRDEQLFGLAFKGFVIRDIVYEDGAAPIPADNVESIAGTWTGLHQLVLNPGGVSVVRAEAEVRSAVSPVAEVISGGWFAENKQPVIV